MCACWASDPSLRPSFTEVAERLDALVEQWKMDPSSSTQLLSKLSPECTWSLSLLDCTSDGLRSVAYFFRDTHCF